MTDQSRAPDGARLFSGGRIPDAPAAPHRVLVLVIELVIEIFMTHSPPSRGGCGSRLPVVSRSGSAAALETVGPGNRRWAGHGDEFR
jgi:hypothetical protein